MTKARDTKQAPRESPRVPDGPVSFLSGSDVDWLWLTMPPLEERPNDGRAALEALNKRRTKLSNETRLKLQQDHFANEYFELAYREDLTRGAERLVTRARQILADKQAEARKTRKVDAKKLAQIIRRDAKKCKEITKHRAKTFLIRKKTDDV